MKQVLLLLIAFISSEAIAQPATPVIRKGFLFGAALGAANATMNFPARSQNQTDLAINWKIGYMVRPRLALVLNGAVSMYDYTGTGRTRKRDFGGIFPSAQYWLSGNLWVLGGVGLGTDAPVFYDIQPDQVAETQYHLGAGLISSVGYEMYRKKNFTLDLQLRLNYNRVKLPEGKTHGFNTGLLLGFNFY